MNQTSRIMGLIMALMCIGASTNATDNEFSEHPLKIPAGKYVFIPSLYDNYRIVGSLLNDGLQGYRLISDDSFLKLKRGDFLFARPLDPGPEQFRAFDEISQSYPLKNIGPSSKAPVALPVKHMKIGIYCGKGVTAGYLWHFYPMEKSLTDVVFLRESDIDTLKDIDVICFPSGGRYRDAISAAGQDHLKDLIHKQGVGFLGTCGGNVFGCQLMLLDATLEPQTNGDPFGVPVNGHPPMALNAPDHPAMVSAFETIHPFYYWGQVFQHVGPTACILASYTAHHKAYSFDGSPYKGEAWQTMTGRPGVISGKFGSGRVILSGLHPEVGEEQLFMDWVYYLGGNHSKRIKTAFKPSQAIADQQDRSLWDDILSETASFKALLSPYANKIDPWWKDRRRRHITMGLPVLMIFSDIQNRIVHLNELAENERLATDDCRLPITRMLVNRIRVARLAFDGLCPDLERTLKMLRENDRLPSEIKKKLSTQKHFYPDDYFMLIENLKSVNLPLIEIDYSFKRQKNHLRF